MRQCPECAVIPGPCGSLTKRETFPHSSKAGVRAAGLLESWGLGERYGQGAMQ